PVAHEFFQHLSSTGYVVQICTGFCLDQHHLRSTHIHHVVCKCTGCTNPKLLLVVWQIAALPGCIPPTFSHVIITYMLVKQSVDQFLLTQSCVYAGIYVNLTNKRMSIVGLLFDQLGAPNPFDIIPVVKTVVHLTHY